MSGQDQIYRTSPQRTLYMMVIMLGICIAGGVIFFSMWDYWISIPPAVTVMAADHDETPAAAATGKTVPVSLSFIESPDFRTLAFNALPGEDGNNPSIEVSVGDKIEFDVVNDGISFHAFGVTSNDEGFTGIISGSEIAAASNPLKGGESGQSEFIAPKEGIYYYICTVPGHRAQGMEGTIIVKGESSDDADSTSASHYFELDIAESDDSTAESEMSKESVSPAFTVKSGDEITFATSSTGVSFNACGITSDREDLENDEWNMALPAAVDPAQSGESGVMTITAEDPGKYYFICTIPGNEVQEIKGSFIVE